MGYGRAPYFKIDYDYKTSQQHIVSVIEREKGWLLTNFDT